MKDCPTQAGKFIGYGIEWTRPDILLWKSIPIKILNNTTHGVPFPKMYGGILETIMLYGFEQANALRYTYAAAAAQAGDSIKTRIVTYEVNYDIRARKIAKKTR